MRTTLDLPDELLRQAKVAAVQRGSTLRELVTVALRRELAAPAGEFARHPRLPVIRLARDAPILKLTAEEIKALIAEDDEATDLAGAG